MSDPILEPPGKDDADDEEFAREPDDQPGGDPWPDRSCDGAYWAKEAERLATTEAKRILGSLAMAAARAHIRATLARWEREVWC